MEDNRNRVSLYLYGELSAEAEAKFEEELAESPGLAAAVEEERKLIELLRQRRPMEVSHEQADAYRADLMATIRQESAAAERQSWSARFATLFFPNQSAFAWQAALAVALVIAGFLGGRLTQELRTSPDQAIVASAARGVNGASPASYSDLPDVRSISAAPGGSGVEIVVEERRTIRGNPHDPQIQSLLISMARSANSGMRLETIDLLRGRAADEQVRSTLVSAMLEDENDGVRLKALEALSPYQDQFEVRQALMTSLRNDSNPGMRVSAIELLTVNPDRALVDVLQDVVRYDPNNYVRLVSEQTLEDLNASIGLY